MSELEGQHPHGQAGGEPTEGDADVDRLLEEFGSLYASLSKHQRPMAVMFADLKGSTAIFGERSDIEGILVLQRSESLIRPAVEAHRGTVVKTIGDAVMASFPSSDDAVRAAVAVQKAMEEHNRELASEDQLFVRIGINTGKGFIKGHDVFGQVVNIAAKVQGASEGGQILVSKSTYESMGKELAQYAVARGSLEVAGLSQPVDVYQVLWHEEHRSAAAVPLRAPPVEKVEEKEEDEERRLLVVDLSLEGGRLKVSAFERYPGEERTLKPYKEIPYPKDLIERLRRDLFNVLNQASLHGVLEEALMQEVESLGHTLFETLFPEPVRERLLQPSASSLLLHTDDRLVQIPWELVFDGRQFLSQRFNMGRVVRTRQTPSEGRARPVRRPLRMLILANPRGDLEASFLEGTQIRDSLVSNGVDVEVELLHSEVTLEEVKRSIHDYDILHFAGHADYDVEDPETSSWMFSDGELRPSELSSWAEGGSLPALVFSNACQSGYTEEWRVSEHLGREIFGMANAFLLTGVQHYIGTFWEIPDAPSAQFALSFYKGLVKGEPIGKALHQARQSIIERFGKETVIWASYMLYGDPTVSLFPHEKEPALKLVSQPPAESRAEEPLSVEDAPPVAAPAEEPARRGGLVYGLAAAAAACLLAVGGYLVFSKGSGEPTKAVTQAPVASKGVESGPSASSQASTGQAAPLLTISQIEKLLLTSKNFDTQNLSGMDLQGRDFSEASFKGANLKGAVLSEAVLWKATLSGSDLSGANLSGAKLGQSLIDGASLKKADLSGSDLSGASFKKADLSGADLAGAKLWGADLKGADLKEAKFNDTNLLHADLSGADFSRADLTGANLYGANLEGTIFTGAHVEGAKNLWKANNADKAIGLNVE